MMIVTVDSERRIVLPEGFHVNHGDNVIVKLMGDHLAIERLEVISDDEFKSALAETSQLYSEAFKRLAKGE